MPAYRQHYKLECHEKGKLIHDVINLNSITKHLSACLKYTFYTKTNINQYFLF